LQSRPWPGCGATAVATMSRLIVKNLPTSSNLEAKLRSTFSAHGAVTDLQLKYNKQGKFRGFAFVGFKEEEEAVKAREWLNDTYIGAVKIRVEQCKDLAAGEDASKNNNKKVETVKKDVVESGIDKYRDDVKFQEFAKAATGDDVLTDVKTIKKVDIIEEGDLEDGESKENNGLSDLDYIKSKTVEKVKKSVDLFTVKITGIPYKCKKKDIKMFFGPDLKPKSVRVPPKIRGIAFAGFATEKEQKQALVKNKSFVGQNQVLVVRYVSKLPAAEPEETVPGAGRWAAQEAALAGTETVGESGRIFVRNLSYATTEADIEELFGKFGPLTESRYGIHCIAALTTAHSLPIDRLTRKQKGFAFVTFMLPEHAVAAFSALDGTTLQVRCRHLSWIVILDVPVVRFGSS
jgi:multiple RNA-binding domain-containing protein 1